VLKIYKQFWQVNWAEQWQYRANLLMYQLFWLVSPVVYLAVWVTVATNQGSVSGLTANDFITYYMTLLIVDQLTSDITIHILAYKIQDGTLASELLRPVHPILTQTLIYNIAFKALSFMVLIPVWIVLLLLFTPNFSGVTWLSLLVALPVILIGFLINFLIGASLTSLAFWTTRVYSISEFYAAVVTLFSGQFVPLTLMPGLIQDVAQVLPFQLFKYAPIEIILNRLTGAQILETYAAGLVWLVAAWFLFNWVWRVGIKRFSAVGA
jgi:ABC-2 type transport system permease protein